MWIFEYLVGTVPSVILISSLFIFKSFWAKTIKTYWVRGIGIVWTLVSIIYFYITNVNTKDFNSTMNTLFYWELCNIVSWASLILMVIPSRLNLQLILPLALVGPTMAIFIPTELSLSLHFDNFRYWEFYFSHLSGLFTYLYMYLYGYTNTKLDWQFIRRSASFAFILLTFVEVWNLLFMKGNVDPLSTPTGVINDYFYPNFIYKNIFNNIGLGSLNMAAQYFLMILVFCPLVMILIWTFLYFVRPIYLDKGETRVKFDIHENLLDLKNVFSKERVKLLYNKIIKNKESKEEEL